MTWTAPRWLRQVAGPNALTLPGWLLLGIPSIVGGAAMLAGSLRQGLAQGFAWGTVAWLALGVVWLLARYTWMAGGSARRRELLIIPTYMLGGVVRASVIAATAESVNVRATIALSIINMTGLSIVLTIVVDRMRTLDLAAGRLDAIRKGLEEAQARAIRESAQLRASAREAILAGLRATFRESGNPAALAQGLRDVSELVVRPMSHELASPYSDPDAVPFARPRRDLPSVARAILDAGPIRPLLTALLYCLFVLPLAFHVHGWPGMVAIMAVTAACLATLLGLARLIPWSRLPTGFGIVLLVAVLGATGAASIVVLRLGPGQVGPLTGGAGYAAVFLFLLGGCIATLRGFALRQAQIEESLIVEARELSTAVRSEQAALRRDRRHLARVLHGVVQPRLVARALQLQRTDGPLDVDELEVEIVALLSHETDSLETIDVRRALQDVSEIWADTVDVVVDVPEAVTELLTSYPPCSLAISEVACEAVNNAVLRGGAQSVAVAVRVEGASVRLRVANDTGAMPRPLGPPGMGSELYQELADSWEITAGPGGVEFQAAFSLDSRASAVIGDEGPTLGGASGVLADHRGPGDFGAV
ncbi:MAG: hypothetical protein ACR2KE_04085 [Candidatus Nanopelagicales bacterium]